MRLGRRTAGRAAVERGRMSGRILEIFTDFERFGVQLGARVTGGSGISTR